MEDGTLVEVEASEHESVQLSSSSADKVAASFAAVRPLLLKLCAQLSGAWETLASDVEITGAEVELAFGFEAEGNVFLAKTKGNGNMKVKVAFKPRKDE